MNVTKEVIQPVNPTMRFVIEMTDEEIVSFNKLLTVTRARMDEAKTSTSSSGVRTYHMQFICEDKSVRVRDLNQTAYDVCSKLEDMLAR